MEECHFCKLMNGQAQSFPVYEDDFAFAFLDKHPIRTGHLLVIPKSHQ